MKKLVIIGAGGFGREVQWLIERINEREAIWELLGYVDDGVEKGTIVDGLPVLGTVKELREREESLAVVCAVGASVTRRKILEQILDNTKLEFPNLIDPSVQMSKRIDMGRGNIICAGNILTVDITMGDFNIVNLDCTVGHDVVFDSYITVYPSVNISGGVEIGEKVELGTGSQIIQGIHIVEDIIVGAGSVVVRNLAEAGTYVGVPAKKLMN